MKCLKRSSGERICGAQSGSGCGRLGMPAGRLPFYLPLYLDRQVDFEDIYTEGITKITAQDMRYAKEMDMVIKLLATMQAGRRQQSGAIVAPFLTSLRAPALQASMVCSMRSSYGAMPWETPCSMAAGQARCLRQAL